jgi:hypothetical protein
MGALGTALALGALLAVRAVAAVSVGLPFRGTLDLLKHTRLDLMRGRDEEVAGGETDAAKGEE